MIFFGCGSWSGTRSRATLCPAASVFESWKRESSAVEGLETTQPRRVKSFWMLYGRVSGGMVRMWEGIAYLGDSRRRSWERSKKSVANSSMASAMAHI